MSTRFFCLCVTFAGLSVVPQDVRKFESGDKKTLTVVLSRDVRLVMALIPAGQFIMGSKAVPGEKIEEANLEERPQHEVWITKDFYLGKYEVTRGQFLQFVEDTKYKTDAEKDGQGGTGYDADTNRGTNRNPKFTWRYVGYEYSNAHPVVNVSWNDANAFCDWLSKKTGRRFRLPTEAEWEYACRAGTTTRYYSGDDPETLAKVGNVKDAAVRRIHPNIPITEAIAADDGYRFTAPVGKFQKNAFGLYDMHGNVFEFCNDWMDHHYYSKNPPEEDPAGPSTGTLRVMRGGSFYTGPRRCSSAFRLGYHPTDRYFGVGFRVARER